MHLLVGKKIKNSKNIEWLVINVVGYIKMEDVV
jgi:hypothetical protein